MTTKAQRAAARCKHCRGGAVHHTIEDECWCPDCLRRPEGSRCTTFEPGEPPKPVGRNVAPVGHRHPATAKVAATHALPRAGTKRRKVYDEIAKRQGATDDELEYVTGWSHQSVSAARNTLMEDGLIIDGGARRKTRYDNDAIVWVVVPLG